MTADFAYPPSVYTMNSNRGFDATAERIRGALTAQGMTIFADIDQSAAAESVGLHLRPTRLLLFGNPKTGTPVMQANPYAGLELPLRLLVWEGDTGTVSVSFHNPVDVLHVHYELDTTALEPLRKVRALLESMVSEP